MRTGKHLENLERESIALCQLMQKPKKPSQDNENNSVPGRMKSLPGSSGTLERCPERVSILLIGSTGDGKSATVNHLLDTDTVKTGSFEPETKETVEYLLAIKNQDNEDSNLELSIIDTPGLNDPRGIKQDACNLHSMKCFFKTHPLFSKSECYPNLVFLVISANEHSIDGSSSKLANNLRALNELGVVDKQHPNVVAILTFCCSVSFYNVQKWGQIMKEKQKIISRNIHQALGIRATVVLLENDADSNDLKKDGEFTVLPDNDRQPENLYKACQKILEDNRDYLGLSSFNSGLAQNNAKKQYCVADYKVLANDSSTNPISEVEQDLLNILRGSTEDGKEVMETIGSGQRRKSGSRSKFLRNSNGDCRCTGKKLAVILIVVALVISLIVILIICAH